MSEKHLPYIGGNFDRIVFNGDGSTWVREQLGTRYSELFGTPERAARTLMGFGPLSCFRCALYDLCSEVLGEDCLLCDYDKLLERLRGDAE